MIAIIWITLTTVLITAQTIQVQEINNGKGYTILQKGIKELPTSYEEFITIINKTNIELAYSRLENEFKNNLILQTNMIEKYLKLAEAEKKLFYVSHKRGLANIVGSSMKFLFGTLDEGDKRDILSRLESLEASTLTSNDIHNILDHINQEDQLVNVLQNATNVLQNQIVKR